MTKASVVLAGCGSPLRSMGWYHATQLLEGRCPSAELKYVVEPWYMQKAAENSPGYKEFHDWKNKLETEQKISFYQTVEEVPFPSDGELRLGIISARTADNPKLLNGCLDIGCKAIFLEKPGAPSVAELEQMRDKAKDANVTVFMGFNKNVSSYLGRTRDFAAKTEGKVDVTFLHNNAYQDNEAELGECFERNSEGMLKNMAIHELAILTTFYDVSVDNIASVEPDKSFSSCKTLKGPSGTSFTDFDKVKFKITTKDGHEVSVAADRCGGDDSVGIVTDAATGEELARYTMPDEEVVANIPNLEKKFPGVMPYFLTQDPDYATLKQRVAKNLVDGTPAEGVATIDVACETLKVAEYLTPILQKELLQ
mmetsp:Transcript_91/g.174  ORF Transcript_91/g.174 Transcript_91/m.174 type:complete len:367 (+) Transcript_91:174-1274(+)